MKALYMVDVPKIDDCESCPLYNIEDVLDRTKIVCVADKEDGDVCPLRPLPKKLIPEMVLGNKFAEGCVQGWNDCLDEILGDYITQEEADLCGVQLWHDD